MIFLDSNVPMYLVGASARHRIDVQQMLERAVEMRERLVTNAEVLQEILHRYIAIRRPEAIQPAFDAILGVVDDVFPVTRDDVERAKSIAMGGGGRRSARDALHLATMERHGIRRIMTFDTGFDGYPGIARVTL